MADQAREEEIKASTNAASQPKSHETEENLVDDKSSKGEDFKGATLELAGSRDSEPQVGFEGPGSNRPVMKTGRSSSVEVDLGISRDRPGSVIGRKSTMSTGSRTSMSPKMNESDFTTKLYFCHKVSSYIANLHASLLVQFLHCCSRLHDDDSYL